MPGTPVDHEDYQAPFAFTGRLSKLTISIDRPKLTRRREAADSSAAQQQGKR
jgi:hypothetical protein